MLGARRSSDAWSQISSGAVSKGVYGFASPAPPPSTTVKLPPSMDPS
jgi:hypothetical protein